MAFWWERVRERLSMRARTHDSLPDLRGLPSEPVRVERTHYVAHDRQRDDLGERAWVLHREPRSTRDSSAVAVFARGRAIGYLPPESSRAIAPLLELLGGKAVVTGLGAAPGSSRFWLNLPTRDSLESATSERRALKG